MHSTKIITAECVVYHMPDVRRKQAAGQGPPFEDVCTCKRCDHGLARDCSKAGCRCCKAENHSMIMDGIEGFAPTDSRGGRNS